MPEPILDILSAYIDRRDNAKKSSPFYVAGNKGVRAMSEFSQMIDRHHMLLSEHLPPMNLAEMEAFCELMNSRLNWMRNQGTR